jgi:hypothetical protein
MKMKTHGPQTSGTDIPMKLAEQIKRVENVFNPILLDKNESPFELTIQKLMQIYKVPDVVRALYEHPSHSL